MTIPWISQSFYFFVTLNLPIGLSQPFRIDPVFTFLHSFDLSLLHDSLLDRSSFTHHIYQKVFPNRSLQTFQIFTAPPVLNKSFNRPVLQRQRQALLIYIQWAVNQFYYTIKTNQNRMLGKVGFSMFFILFFLSENGHSQLFFVCVCFLDRQFRDLRQDHLRRRTGRRTGTTERRSLWTTQLIFFFRDWTRPFHSRQQSKWRH